MTPLVFPTIKSSQINASARKFPRTNPTQLFQGPTPTTVMYVLPIAGEAQFNAFGSVKIDLKTAKKIVQ